MKKIFIHIGLSLFLFSNVFSQPSNSDYIWGYGGVAAFFALQFPLQDEFCPQNPHWTEPDQFDLEVRNNLKWQDQQLGQAALYSDVLLRGIFLPSVFWTPLLTKYKYSDHLLLNLQVTATTGILTNIVKYISGRERPYSFYGTMESKGNDDYLSFFSGHTSLSFAVATSTAMVFEKQEPQISGLLWSSLLTAAGLTGYFRIAADKHYATDVITGAVVGTLTAYLITKSQQKRFFQNKKSSNEVMQFRFIIPLK